MSKNILNKIFAIYIFMQPVLDLFTGLITKIYGNTLSIGVVIRTLFMAAIALYAIYVAKKSDKRKLIIYYSIVAIYSLVFLLLAYNRYQLTSIFIQLKGIIKVIYLPVVLAGMYIINKEKNLNIDSRVLVCTLFVYTFTILVGKITGVSYKSYNTIKQSAGTVGLFYSANEIGAVLCLLAPFLINDFLKRKGNMILNIASIILLIFSAFEIGTKVPLIGVFGAIFGAIIVSAIMYFKEKENIHIKNILYTVITFIVCFFVIGYTPVGINLEDTYGSLFPKIGGKEKINHMVEIGSVEELQSVLTSKRSDVLKMNEERFNNESFMVKLFGMGYLKEKNGEIIENKLIEMDYFDIFLNHGVIGTIIIFTPLIALLCIAIKKICLNIKKVLEDSEMIYSCYSVLIALLIALLAGHVLTAPAVSIFLVISLIEVVKKDYNLSK